MIVTALEILAAITALAGLIIGLRSLWTDEYTGTFGRIMLTPCFTAAAFIAFTGFAMASTGIANLILNHDDTYDQVNLAALQDGTNVSGEFFLGIGTLEGKPAYTFYEDLGAGGLHLASVYAQDVRVFQDSDVPYAIRFTDCELSIPWLAACLNDGVQIDEIHVPVGTVRSDYVLDAK